MGMARQRGEKRRQRRIRLVRDMAQCPSQLQPDPGAAGCRHRQPTCGEHDSRRLQVALCCDDGPASVRRLEIDEFRVEPQGHAFWPGEGDESVAHVTRPVRNRELLAAVGFQLEWHADVAFKKLSLSSQRPRTEESLDEGGGESVTKRFGSSVSGSTWQRPPPLIRILRPPSAVLSISVTWLPGAAREGRGRQSRSACAHDDDHV
jgi:hypothetical protein